MSFVFISACACFLNERFTIKLGLQFAIVFSTIVLAPLKCLRIGSQRSECIITALLTLEHRMIPLELTDRPVIFATLVNVTVC